jgi:hypothetical protein
VHPGENIGRPPAIEVGIEEIDQLKLLIHQDDGTAG